MPEFKILNNVIDYMESTGTTYKLVSISIDQSIVDEINKDNKTNYTQQELEKATDKCLAYEWLTHRSCGNKYRNLVITPKGVGAARSKRKAEELKSSRSLIKRVSDYIEDHKGLFVVLGFIVTVGTFALKIFGE